MQKVSRTIMHNVCVKLYNSTSPKYSMRTNPQPCIKYD